LRWFKERDEFLFITGTLYLEGSQSKKDKKDEKRRAKRG
jgi:hypothetical protein